MGDERSDISGSGQVSDAEIYLGTGPLTDLTSRLRQALPVAAGDHDARAFAGKLLGNGPAQPLARRRHQRHLAFESEIQNFLLTVRSRIIPGASHPAATANST